MTMNRPSERLIWIGVAVIAVIGGVMVGANLERSNQAQPKPKAQSSRNNPGAVNAENRNEPRRGEIRDEQELKKMANHALSTPNRTERYQRVMEMLDSTTAKNWNVLWNEYIRQTLEEGRVHEAEWSLFMNRVGEVAGPDAMEFFTHNGQNQYTFNRREVLLGWSSVDPQGALAWLKGQPESEAPREFWGAVMDGVAAKDSALALQMLREVPDQYSAAVVRGTVDTLIQSEGLVNTTKFLEKMVAEIPEGSTMPDRLQYFYKEIQSRAQRMQWLASSYPDMPTHEASLESLKAVFEPGAESPAEEDISR